MIDVISCSTESDGVSSDDDDDECKFDPLLLKLHMHNVIIIGLSL